MRAPKRGSQHQTSRNGREQLTFLAILLLGFALLSISGCTGLTQASSTATKPGSSSSNAPTGASASISASQTTLNFSRVDVGTKHALSVVFRNTGKSEVTISHVTVAGAGYNASGVQSGQILSPSETATLSVTFEPSATGSLTGSVTLMSNAANSPEKVSLSGTGVQPTAHSTILHWTPSASVVSAYNLYRSTASGGPYTRLTEASGTATSLTDAAVTSGHTYFYVMTSVESGVESAYSGEVSATIPEE